MLTDKYNPSLKKEKSMIIKAYIYSTLIIFIYMTITFIVAQLKKNNGLADIAWEVDFLIIAFFTFFNYRSYLFVQMITTTLELIWATRISGYILLRNWGKPEDIRYANMRTQWGNSFILHGFFKVFMLQGVILLIIMASVIAINSTDYEPLVLFNILGTIIWIIGFLCETIGDYQLYDFLHDPNSKGGIMMQGLWKYTQHPNRFSESMMWWGI